MTQPEMFRLLAMRSALKLEILGMKRKGPSVFSIIKKEFGLKGSKEKVLSEYTVIVDQLKKEGVNE